MGNINLPAPVILALLWLRNAADEDSALSPRSCQSERVPAWQLPTSSNPKLHGSWSARGQLATMSDLWALPYREQARHDRCDQEYFSD